MKSMSVDRTRRILEAGFASFHRLQALAHFTDCHQEFRHISHARIKRFGSVVRDRGQLLEMGVADAGLRVRAASRR